MLSIKVARFLAPNSRAIDQNSALRDVQEIGIGISRTNYQAGLDYLEGYQERKHIENATKKASADGLNEKYPDGQEWIVNEWIAHYKSKARRLKKGLDT